MSSWKHDKDYKIDSMVSDIASKHTPDSVELVTTGGKQTLEDASRPLIKWLNDNGNIHMKAIVQTDMVEVVEGYQLFKTEDYIKN